MKLAREPAIRTPKVLAAQHRMKMHFKHAWSTLNEPYGGTKFYLCGLNSSDLRWTYDL